MNENTMINKKKVALVSNKDQKINDKNFIIYLLEKITKKNINIDLRSDLMLLINRFYKKEEELIKAKKENQNINIKLESIISENKILSDNIKNLLLEKRKLELNRKSIDQELIKLKIDLNRMKTPPLLVGTISKILNEKSLVVRCSSGPKLVIPFPLSINKKDLLPGVHVGLNQQNFSIVSILDEYNDESNISFKELIEPTDVKFDQIGGLDSQINEIKEIIELPMVHPELFEQMNLTPPTGALLYGPPGTGKTMIAKAIANSTNATFIRVVGSELVQKYIGDGSKMVHDLFSFAKKKSPSIIFIDEIDSIASKRIEEGQGADREVYRILIYEMDGFEKLSNVKIIGATNRIESLDKAILRPGRFDRLIYIPLPNLEGRLSILKIHTNLMPIESNINLNDIAKETDSLSGADLKNITIEAGMFAIRSNRKTITKNDFKNAIQKIKNKINNDIKNEPKNMFF